MQITSIEFAAFVGAVLAIFYALPLRWQSWWLLLASYVFYVSWAWQFALVLLALTGATFALGQRVRIDGRQRPGVLWLGIAINLGALALFKYGDALLHQLPAAVQPSARILLPIGLSFYALQAVSYLIDVSRGQLTAERDAAAFALYLGYFPKLLAGPIERARTFLPQLRAARLLDDVQLARAATLIVIGLVRKLVIADALTATTPPATFADPASASGLAPWLMVYSFALYNDFAGYTSLVRGVSLLFGIELSPNFAGPYFSRSISEFWTRWNITLSQWLRDYVYMPLSRALLRRNLSRTNVPNLILPPLAAMLACGIWHGEGWRFVVWGAMHGVYLVGERVVGLWRPPVPMHLRSAWRQGLSMVWVVGLIALTLIPFRMEVDAALAFVRGLFGAPAWVLPDPRAAALMLLSLWIDVVQVRGGDEAVFVRWPRLARAALLAGAALAVFVATRHDSGVPFVYQRF